MELDVNPRRNTFRVRKELRIFLIAGRVTATQPAVGVMPGAARWKKIADPAPGRGFSEVPVEDDEDVIEPVLPPEVLVAGGVWEAYRAVIVPVGGVVAPAVEASCWHRGQPRVGPGDTVRPVATGDESQPSGGCRAVALAFVAGDAAPPERAGHGQGARNEQAAGGVAPRRPHDDPFEGSARCHALLP